MFVGLRDYVWGPLHVGGRDKAIKASEFQEEANQTNTTGPDFGTHQGYPEHQTM